MHGHHMYVYMYNRSVQEPKILRSSWSDLFLAQGIYRLQYKYLAKTLSQ